MSNIIDTIQVSGVQYTLSAQTSGGTFDLPIYSGTGTNALKLNYSGNTASGDYSVAEGYFTSASSYYSHAEGYGTTASSNAHAEGQLTKANGDTSHAEGYATTAKGIYSHAEGQGTSASGNTSHAEGQGTKAIGNTSHAEGNRTSASGQSSHAEGNGSIASGSSSHAEGYRTQANGHYSHAEGQSTYATSYSSHAEGYGTTASGESSHAEGNVTTANGSSSHAEGSYTETNNHAEHASGYYNVSSSGSTALGHSGNTLFSVGNGTFNARHNAFEIRQNGDIYLSSGGTDIKLQDHLGGGGITSGEVQTMIDESISGKVDTSAITSSVTSASTDSEIPTAKAVYDAIPTGGTSITIDPTLDSGSTNPVANSAITEALKTKVDSTSIANASQIMKNNDGILRWYDVWNYNRTAYQFPIYNFSINGKLPLSKENGTYSDIFNFSLVETSAITTSITSSSTDSQVPSAKAVYDALGGASGCITSGEVQTMIDESISGKADSSSLATVATSGSYDDLTNKPTIPTVPTSNTAFTNDAEYATSGYVDSVVSGKVNTSDNNVSAFSGVPLAINVNENYGSLQLKTIYIKNNDATQHTNVVFGEIKYYNGSYKTTTTISGSSIPQSGITAITNTDTTAHTFTLENGVCRIDFLGSSYLAQISSEGDGFSFYYIHNNNYTSGQSSTVIENTVYDALTELGKDIVDMNDSGRFVNVSKAQDITATKTFVNTDKGIIFKQKENANKVGFSLRSSASTNNEIATFEFRPNTYTDGGGVQHPLLYLGHYRTNAIATNGVVQTMVGFRQYDGSNGINAAYHYLMPLPADAKTTFSLTQTYKNYFAPLGFKNGSTMITTDNTGVADFSSVLGGLKLVKITAADYAQITPDDNTVYFIGDSTNGYTMKLGSANVN